jgi:hypothetical protein
VKREEIISVFSQLRKSLLSIGENVGWKGYSSGITEDEYNQLIELIKREKQFNPWFTEENMRASIKGICDLLEPQQLFAFCQKYSYSKNPKRVGIIMAGNLPFVGFHDVLCVLLSGNSAVCKLSSDDSRFPALLISWMLNWNPKLKERLEISFGTLKNYDAIIATGSNNSMNHFETYFGSYPHIFRKNRTSIAVLDGTETKEEIEKLSSDCFNYFGMGCRSVSKLFVPKDFNLNRIFEGFIVQSELINHNKYGNNYDYNRTIYLMNSIPFLDNNCFMLKEDESLHAPLSVVYFEYYSSKEEINKKLDELKDDIQVVIGRDFVAFGQSQSPKIDDFADGVDTMEWLNQLSSN